MKRPSLSANWKNKFNYIPLMYELILHGQDQKHM